MSSFEILSVSDSADLDEVPVFITDFLTEYQGIQQYALLTPSIDSTSSSLEERGFIMQNVHSFRASEVSEGWSRI